MNLEAKIYNFLKEVEDNKKLSMISFTVANKDEVLFDYKKEPYLKDGLQLVFSITKSFTSLAIGMLYDKGLINLDEKIIGDRKSTRLNSSHVRISYAVFCLKK